MFSLTSKTFRVGLSRTSKSLSKPTSHQKRWTVTTSTMPAMTLGCRMRKREQFSKNFLPSSTCISSGLSMTFSVTCKLKWASRFLSHLCGNQIVIQMQFIQLSLFLIYHARSMTGMNFRLTSIWHPISTNLRTKPPTGNTVYMVSWSIQVMFMEDTTLSWSSLIRIPSGTSSTMIGLLRWPIAKYLKTILVEKC